MPDRRLAAAYAGLALVLLPMALRARRRTPVALLALVPIVGTRV